MTLLSKLLTEQWKRASFCFHFALFLLKRALFWGCWRLQLPTSSLSHRWWGQRPGSTGGLASGDQHPSAQQVSAELVQGTKQGAGEATLWGSPMYGGRTSAWEEMCQGMLVKLILHKCFISLSFCSAAGWIQSSLTFIPSLEQYADESTGYG